MKKLRIHNNIAYIILRTKLISKFEDGNVLNMNKVKAFRDWVKADHVLKEQNYFLFCETVQDVDFEDMYHKNDE